MILQEHGLRWQGQLPGLTRPQYAVLRVIDAKPGIEQMAVARAAAMDKATLAPLLLRLERRGLITREVDIDDRRRRLVRLTAAGRHTLRAASSCANALNSKMLDRLTSAEQRQLHTLLGKLADRPVSESASHLC
ncbi:MarR family winged helix-turn-helix transcriptional regulator [Nonomuraea helvata]|uniref:MarR family transcriptional regulator n=1 Tax=Nonomuraea helvata TaxID=37484 RepID=A0ABV5S797_9ACTN